MKKPFEWHIPMIGFGFEGRVIGRVTSCSVDKDGWIIGMAMIESAYKQEGTSIFIYQNSEKLELKDQAHFNREIER